MQGKHAVICFCPILYKTGRKANTSIPLGEAKPRLRHGYKEWRAGGRPARRQAWRSLRRPPLRPASSQLVAQKSSVSSTSSGGCHDG
ncbi:hypothetical protein E2C01_000146 [Portunus trituberculatus]|uniref:Uncharacterized protein n=1 Tax=Portunus trituberculatus TaxID=210409 RepID=A0A5B7CDA3_PORTR|nr:hypothetical protein [Portunus trituberculatus]